MNIKEYIKKQGLTYRSFARLGGWNPCTVAFWAQGRRYPNPANAQLVERVTMGRVSAAEARTPTTKKR